MSYENSGYLVIPYFVMLFFALRPSSSIFHAYCWSQKWRCLCSGLALTRIQVMLYHQLYPPPRKRQLLKDRPFLLLLSLSVLLILLLLSQVLSDWSLFSTPGYASTIQSGHDTPPSFTYQQYLKQRPKPALVKSGPPSPYPQPPKPPAGSKPATRPPSAEPATMQPLKQPLNKCLPGRQYRHA